MGLKPARSHLCPIYTGRSTVGWPYVVCPAGGLVWQLITYPYCEVAKVRPPTSSRSLNCVGHFGCCCVQLCVLRTLLPGFSNMRAPGSGRRDRLLI